MKKFLLLFSSVLLALTVFSSQVNAFLLTYNDSNYLGLFDPATPANELTEAGYINVLIGLLPTPPAPPVSTMVGSQTYFPSTYDPISLTEIVIPDPFVDYYRNDNSNTTLPLNMTDYTYVLGKYGQTALVWYIGGYTSSDGQIELPSNFSLPGSNYGGGLSHSTAFVAGNPVPEPATMLLFGIGLVGLAGLGRNRKKN